MADAVGRAFDWMRIVPTPLIRGRVSRRRLPPVRLANTLQDQHWQLRAALPSMLTRSTAIQKGILAMLQTHGFTFSHTVAIPIMRTPT